MVEWTLAEIDWSRFNLDAVEPQLLLAVKAAAMVESNIDVYWRYLHNVFADDPVLCRQIDGWAADEVRHGEALARWAKLADPTFDFETAFADYCARITLPVDALNASVRGSRTGELVSRCVIEAGTTTYYWAIRDRTREPVLRQIAALIAQDEVRHYKLFRARIDDYAQREGIGRWRRRKVAFARLRETEEDELAYALYAVSGAEEPYERKRWLAAYMNAAYPNYRRDHLDRAVTMAFKAVSLPTKGLLHRLTTTTAWHLMQRRAKSGAS